MKKSLQDLSRAINGDSKSEAQPLFKTNVVLTSNSSNNTVEYKPSMIDLTSQVNVVSQELITTVAIVPRLVDVLAQRPKRAAKGDGDDDEDDDEDDEDDDANDPNPSGLPSFYDCICDSDDIMKICVTIMNGMTASATELQKYLHYWDKYKSLWDSDKDAFIRRYAKANRSLAQFDFDITAYKDQQQDVQNEELSTSINYVKVECALLKASLVEHCLGWQTRLTSLLNSIAEAELNSITSMLSKSTDILTKRPSSLDELSTSIHLLQDVQENGDTIVARFEPLEEMYQLLTKYEVQISENETADLAQLRGSWSEFSQMLIGAEKMLQSSKKGMKMDLETSVDDFMQLVGDTRKSSLLKLCYNDDFSIPDAQKILAEWKSRRGLEGKGGKPEARHVHLWHRATEVQGPGRN